MNQIREQVSRLEASSDQYAVGEIFTLIRLKNRLRELEIGVTRPARVLQVKLCLAETDPFDTRSEEEKRVPPFDFDAPVGPATMKAYQDAVKAQRAAEDRRIVVSPAKHISSMCLPEVKIEEIPCDSSFQVCDGFEVIKNIGPGINNIQAKQGVNQVRVWSPRNKTVLKRQRDASNKLAPLPLTWLVDAEGSGDEEVEDMNTPPKGSNTSLVVYQGGMSHKQEEGLKGSRKSQKLNEAKPRNLEEESNVEAELNPLAALTVESSNKSVERIQVQVEPKRKFRTKATIKAARKLNVDIEVVTDSGENSSKSTPAAAGGTD